MILVKIGFILSVISIFLWIAVISTIGFSWPAYGWLSLSAFAAGYLGSYWYNRLDKSDI